MYETMAISSFDSDVLSIDFGAKRKNLRILCIGDIHYGSEGCAEDEFYELIKWAHKEENLHVIGMGDYLDLASKHSVGDVHNQKITPDEQINWILDVFRPFRRRLIGLIAGNHEDRVVRETGIDIVKLVADNLKCPYLGYGGFQSWKIGTQNYSAYICHGSSGSSKTWTKLKSVIDMGAFCNVDLVASGHTHTLDTTTQRIFSVENGKLTEKVCTFVLTGSWLKWLNTYAQKRNFAPARLGNPIIKLNGVHKEIEVDLNAHTGHKIYK